MGISRTKINYCYVLFFSADGRSGVKSWAARSTVNDSTSTILACKPAFSIASTLVFTFSEREATTSKSIKAGFFAAGPIGVKSRLISSMG